MPGCAQSGCFSRATERVRVRGADGRWGTRGYCAVHAQQHSDAPLARGLSSTVSVPPGPDQERAERQRRAVEAPSQEPRMVGDRRWYPQLATSGYTVILAYCLGLGHVPGPGVERSDCARVTGITRERIGRYVCSMRQAGLIRGLQVVRPAADDELAFRRGGMT